VPAINTSSNANAESILRRLCSWFITTPPVIDQQTCASGH
jgi:hypothetical protein